MAGNKYRSDYDFMSAVYDFDQQDEPSYLNRPMLVYLERNISKRRVKVNLQDSTFLASRLQSQPMNFSIQSSSEDNLIKVLNNSSCQIFRQELSVLVICYTYFHYME